MQEVDKVNEARTVKMRLQGHEDDAIWLLSMFSDTARREGWTPAEILEVVDEATGDNLVHLLAVIRKHTRES